MILSTYRDWLLEIENTITNTFEKYHFFSITRYIAYILKNRYSKCESYNNLTSIQKNRFEKEFIAKSHKSSNFLYRTISLVFIILIIILTPIIKLSENYCGLLGIALFKTIIIIYSISRANEVIGAFLLDAFRIARGEPAKSDLSIEDRIKLNLWSYISLIIDFGLLYWVFGNNSTFDCFLYNKKGLSVNSINILDAIYFSGVTIATIGYGDITPQNWITKFLVIYEVICGISLIVISFAIYIGDRDKEREDKNMNDSKKLPEFITKMGIELKKKQPSLMEIIEMIWKDKDNYIKWAKKGSLFIPNCVRQKYHQYSQREIQLIKNKGLSPDTRSNGPAIMAFLIDDGERPKRESNNKGWPIHHIYDGNFPSNSSNKTIHAVKDGNNFTHSACLVALHPFAHGLADECAYFAWLLRFEAFRKFKYDPDNVFV